MRTVHVAMVLIAVAALAAIIPSADTSDAADDEFIDTVHHMKCIALSDEEAILREVMWNDIPVDERRSVLDLPERVGPDKQPDMYRLTAISAFQLPGGDDKVKVTRINIPANITLISGGQFYNCESLTYIGQDGNPDYTSVDGVLYSHDLKTIIQFPQCKAVDGGTWTTPVETETVGSYQFSLNKCIVDFKITSNVHMLERGAFEDAVELRTFQVADGHKNRLNHIGDSAFSGCTELREFECGSAMQDICQNAFTSTGLTSIFIPSTLIYLDPNAFLECTSLMAIEIEDGGDHYISVDGQVIDLWTSSLILYPPGKEDRTFLIPDGTFIVGTMQFMGNDYIEEIYYPPSLVFIEYKAFAECQKLRTFGCQTTSRLNSIGEYAFTGCISLTYVGLDNVSYIGDFAFYGCEQMLTFRIPNSVLSIGEEAFTNCKKLRSFQAMNPNGYYAIDNVLFYRIENAHGIQMTLVKYPPELQNGKHTITSYTIPQGTTAIQKMAFEGSHLQTVTLPDDMSLIDQYQLSNMLELREVVLSPSTVVIGESAFENCPSLTKITGCSKVVTIDNWAFFACVSLEAIPDMPLLTNIGSYAFVGTGVREFTAGETVSYLGQNVFSGCADFSYLEIVNADIDLDPLAFESIGSSEHDVNLVCHKRMLQTFSGEISANVNVKVYEEREFPVENLIGIVVCLILLIAIANSFRRI